MQGANMEEIVKMAQQVASNIAKNQQEDSNQSFEQTNDKFSSLSSAIFFVGIILLIGTFIIAFFTTLSITKPVQRLKRILINCSYSDELRVALVDGAKLFDLDNEFNAQSLLKGSVFKVSSITESAIALT